MARLSKLGHYFLVGVGSVLTVHASARPSYLSRSDEDATRSDWMAVGIDIHSGLNRFRSDLSLVQPELDLGIHEANPATAATR